MFFDKKFKVRVKHFYKTKYSVEYCHYRFIPVWHELCIFFSQTYTSGTECWGTNLFSVKEAELLAKKLRSIEDIRDYYKPMEEQERIFKEEKAEYWAKNAPYKVKGFIGT